jgi:hypothetical protein
VADTALDTTVVTHEAAAQELHRKYASKAVGAVSDQQTTGLILLLVGLAALIVSAGIAWTLSRLSRTQRVESAWLIIVVSFALFLVGIALCWFGVSVLLEGGA